MGLIKTISAICVVLVALTLYFVWGVWNVSIVSASITGITDVDADGFTLTGTMLLENPSRISVRIEQATFTSTLEMTGQKIGTGEINDVFVPPGRTDVPFTQRIEWTPLASAAEQIIGSPTAYVRVDGEAQVLILDTISTRSPILIRADMRSLLLSRLEAMVPQQVLEAAPEIIATGEDLLNAALDTFI